MEGLTSSDQQRGNVDGKHEKGLGDVRGTQAGPGLTSSDGSSSSNDDSDGAAHKSESKQEHARHISRTAESKAGDKDCCDDAALEDMWSYK